MVTAVPFGTRPAGLVPTTMPLATVLLCTWRWPARTAKPSAVSTAVAWLTLTPDTVGTWVKRPEVSHQPPSPRPRPSATTSTTMSSRGPNSQRPRNGSRPTWWRPPPSSRSTTSVWEFSTAGAAWLTRDGPVSYASAGDGVALRAHHPLVAAGVSRSSHGASARPWTPAPITPVSPLGSGMPSLT